MANWGNCDFRELEAFRDKMQRLEEQEAERFCEDCAKELAARLLRKVVKRTPVGQYPAGSGKMGGTLRRGWTAENTTGYVNSLEVRKEGNNYIIDITNPVSYASYVEYGHRTANHKGWVNGHFMLTISEKEIRQSAPAILQRKLEKKLKEVFQ